MKISELKEIRFQCQQSGHCCCDSKIIVTLTFTDVYNLYLAVDKDFESLMKKLAFYKFEKQPKIHQRKKLVLPAISTSDGEVIPGIKKINGLNCTFYNKPNCSIYHNRPLACKNYPFTYLREGKRMKFAWAKNAKNNCPGIDEGAIVETSYIKKNGEETANSLKMHTNLIQELNTEASNGNPLSVREVIWMFIVYGDKVNYP